MRIAICEDEPVYIELIKEKTTGFFLKRNIKTAVDSYTDALLLMNKINDISNDTLFFCLYRIEAEY